MTAEKLARLQKAYDALYAYYKRPGRIEGRFDVSRRMSRLNWKYGFKIKR